MSSATPVVTFTSDRKALADAVGRVARFLPERPPVPVLRGILIEVEAGAVRLVVTDYDDTARASVEAYDVEPGRVLVEGERFARIMRNLPGATVRVSVDGMYATVTSGPTTFRLLTMPEADFPNMDEAPSAPLGKPAGADGVERALSHGESFVKGLRKPWKASKTKTLYAPTDLAPGAWIEWTRHDDGDLLTMRGQVWSPASGTRTVWALVDGERSPVLVRENTYGRTVDGKHERYTALDEFVERKAPARRA